VKLIGTPQSHANQRNIRRTGPPPLANSCPKSGATLVQRKRGLTSPPVYRPNGAASLQRKAGIASPPGYQPPKAAVASPPAYRPNVASPLQRKPGITSPPVYPPLRAAVASPPAYRPNVTSPLQRKTGIASPPFLVPNQRFRTPGPRAAVAPMAKESEDVVQRLPMVYVFHGTGEKVAKDTSKFEDVGEVTRHLPPGAASLRVLSIDVRQESRGDHQYVIAMTSGTTHIKMHWGVNGAVIEFGSGVDNTHGIPKGEYAPKAGLTLSDTVGMFYQLADKKAFVFGEYDCTRLASDLASSIGTYKKGTGEDFDLF
jgi:hypothetical protein